MAKVWEAQDISTYLNWVEAIYGEASDALNNWEVDFLDSVETKLRQKRQITQSQAEILERIYAEKTK